MAVLGSTSRSRRLLIAACAALATPCLAQPPAPVADRADSMPRATGAGAPPPRGLVTVEGLVHDSLGGAPLGGATVQVVSLPRLSRSRTVIADSAGRWRIDSIVPGRYIIGFLHPRWDELGIDLQPARLDLTAGPPAGQILLATPSAQWLHAILCPSPRDSTGAVIGVVRDAEEGGTIAGATVVVTWSELVIGRGGVRREQHRVPITTRDGAFVVCDLPAHVELWMSAEAPGREGGLVEVVVPRGLVLRRDVALGDSITARRITLAARDGAPARTVARGQARLSGTVRDPDGRTMRDAQLVVHGTDVSGRTDDRGAFALGGLPAGTHTLEARAIGYAPRRVAVELSTSRPATADVRLIERATELAATVVMGRRSSGARQLAEFDERRRRSMGGSFITPSDLERMNPYYVSDVLRSTPGLRVVPSARGAGAVVLGRGGCQPTVYLDDMPLLDGAVELDRIVRPTDVAAIEIYAGTGTTPTRFDDRSGCGSVVVWTKR